MKTSKLKNILLLFCSLLLINCQTQNNQNLNIKINYNTNLLHFVDHLSQWSPYTGSDALQFYTKYFQVSKTDSCMIEKYAANRKQLKWKEEIKLFNWASKNFENTPKEYQELKEVIQYFENKKNDSICLKQILQNQFDQLKAQEENIISRSKELDGIFKKYTPYLNVWTDSLNFAKYPIYFCFSHSENSIHGGANGEGTYTEIIVSQKEKGIKRGLTIAAHELIHKLTTISPNIITFLSDDESYTDQANAFLKKNQLNKEDLLTIFQSKDSLGFGNRESKVFEEINVYFIAPVCLENMSEKEIQNKISFYQKHHQIENERVWQGVSLFKKEYEQLEQYNKKDFIWKLIAIFYQDVYFKNYKRLN